MNQGWYQELSNRITSNDEFIGDYLELSRHFFNNKQNSLSSKTLKRLMESASIFACSSEETHKRLALKIAGSVMEADIDNEALTAASELIFLRLGNFPLIRMAIEKYEMKDFFSIYNGNRPLTTLSLNYELTNKVISNQIVIGKNIELFTDFQSNVIKFLSEKEDLSISAPTSAGKSHALKSFIIQSLLTKERFVVVYLVPTRALITQVQKEIRQSFNEYSITDAEIFTSSWEVVGEGKHEFSKAVIILTQERLQTIEGRTDNFQVDFLVVDEAQNIEKGSRGITLEDSIMQLIEWNPDFQIVFISPFSKNPKKFGEIFSYETKDIITKLTPVSQNILYVNIDGKKITIKQVSQELEKILDMAEYDGEKSLPKVGYKRKSWVALNLVDGNSTLVYCDGAHDCIRTAHYLVDNAKNASLNNKELDDAGNFLASYIHPQYYLVDFIKKGVGYHYGNMPASVRTIVESLFKKRLINSVCCTSTLLEGVNFPAKNIILYRPKVGLKNPMDKLGFLNLAGRAGRLMEDFVGNIYCINPQEWRDGYTPKSTPEDHEIGSSMEDVVKKKKDEIISHLKKYVKKRDNEDVMVAVTRFLVNEIRKGNKEFVKNLLQRDKEIRKQDLDDIVKMVKQIVSEIELDGKIIIKNRAIDPRLQNRLYLHLQKMDEPPLPLHPSNFEFYESLLKILSVTNEIFQRKKPENSLKFTAWLSKSWSNEEPLNEIIKQRISYKSKNTQLTKKKINDIIEDDIIKHINHRIRYEVVRDFSCYISILKYVLEEKDGVPEHFDEKVPYYLEIGASTPTTITLINNGIPRSLALLFSEHLPEDLQDFELCKKYIEQNESYIKQKISPALYKELVLF